MIHGDIIPHGLENDQPSYAHLSSRARAGGGLRRNAKIWRSREDAEEGLEFTPAQFPHPDLPPPFLRGIFAPSRLPKAPVPTTTSGTSEELGGFKLQADTSDGWADRAEQADEADGVGPRG